MTAATIAVTLHINGAARSLTLEPHVTLAEVLRGHLGLTGTKVACNRGACSACTVRLDGMTVCSCMLLAVEADGRTVTTIEGVGSAGRLHPVQRAFIEHDAVQCGFCTPGLVMSGVALLERDPGASEAAIRAALAGHYCRCGTYPHVVAALRDVAGTPVI